MGVEAPENRETWLHSTALMKVEMLISLESVNVAFEIFNSCFSIHPTIPIPYGSNHPWFTHVKASHFHFLFILSVMRRISLLTCLLHRRWLTSILLYWQGGFPCNISYLQTRTEETACSFNLFSTTQKNRNAIRTFSLFLKKKSFVLWFFSFFPFCELISKYMLLTRLYLCRH